ncbi:hypothetical protein GCM10010377_60420 [Streptomyces viridiviolaceus]|uniref:Uncharacterized protein n=1 Tax=Streptomyces viridiviolaceus TaxID=68282 RepID=A0ABW2ECX1_9ACTN|nr:hypothetical protein [Streptomyces viridiviolaceus]GHB61429.1 hypothetical protein GCM10010377_60420 [Streptomyces viridiviolaceus]
MAAAEVVGDPACSVAAVGQLDPNLLPQAARIGVGQSGRYTCLIV